MANETKNYPTSIALYKNKFNKEKLVLNTFPALEQDQADRLCAAIQAAVGGTLSVRERGGISKNGKNLPDFELEILTVEHIAERKAFGAAKKAEQQDDASL